MSLHPHIDRDQWLDWIEQGQILSDDQPASADRIVRAGQQYRHLFPETVEPDVSGSIQILGEDDTVVAIHKPAPLPVHPSGRFNLNTLTSILGQVYEPGELRLVHRLDANTTGVMILARTREAATALRSQFERNLVRKSYVAVCHGHPETDEFVCDQPISREREQGGGRRIDAKGHRASTRFQVVRRLEDGTTLLVANPISGRTNQIRVHLWSMGMPIVGDPTYVPGGHLAASQTLGLDDPPMRLHAASLMLSHPTTGVPITVESSAPWAPEQ